MKPLCLQSLHEFACKFSDWSVQKKEDSRSRLLHLRNSGSLADPEYCCTANVFLLLMQDFYADPENSFGAN